MVFVPSVKNNVSQNNMLINPNNLEDLASNLSDLLDTYVNPNFLKLLSEKQRNFLTTLIHLHCTHKKTYNDEDPMEVMREMLDKAKKKDLKGNE